MSLSSSYVAVPARLPHTGWPTRSAFDVLEDVDETEHLVQLYETDPYLVACVSRFIGDALRAGSGALMLTTPEHRQAVEAALDLEEISVRAASRRGQYVVLDAERTLVSITADGQADAASFRHHVGSRLAELTRRWQELRVFNETDALLWQAGRHDEATVLEREWSAARKRQRFARLSAYPASGLSDDFARAAFARLRRGDVRVLPPQRSIDAGVLRAVRTPRAAPPRSTRRRASRTRAEAGKKAAAR